MYAKIFCSNVKHRHTVRCRRILCIILHSKKCVLWPTKYGNTENINRQLLLYTAVNSPPWIKKVIMVSTWEM